MPEPLKPIFEIPVEKARDGTFSCPQLEFSPNEPVLYARVPMEPFSWTATARWYAPDVAAPLLIVAVVLLAIMVRRYVRNPREPGRMYCRRCNYKITPPMAARGQRGEVLVQDGARCPECGTDLGDRLPVVGRRAGARLWPVWAVLLPVIGSCVVALVLTLDRRTGMRGQSWPIADMEKVLGPWAVQKHDSTLQFINTENRITRWRVPQGTRIGGEWWADIYGFNNGFLSPDGSQYVGIVKRSVWPALDLITIDTKTGLQRRAQINENIWGSADILGFARDGSSVYVKALQAPKSNGQYVFKLVRFDLHSLASSEIAAVAVHGQMLRGSYEPPYGQFAVDESSVPIHWAFQLQRYDAARAPTQAEITYFDGHDRHEYVVPAAGTRWNDPRFGDGGKSLEVSYYGNPVSARLDLDTGAITPGVSNNLQYLGTSASTRFRLVQGKGVGDVLDTTTGASIAQLAVPGSQFFGGAAISNDGRFVATAYWSSTSKFVIGVWDLGADAGSRPQTQPAVPAPVP